MGDITKVRMGVCSIKLDGVDLGHTKGGVEVTYSPEYADIVVDTYGNTPVDKVLVKEEFTAKIPLAEITLANLKKVIPSGTLTTSDGKTALKIGRQAGYKLSSQAKQLVLHPIANDAADISEDITVWSAVCIAETTIAKTFDEQTVIEAEFMSLINENQSNGNYLATIGDTTI